MSEYNREELESWTVEELREELADNELPVSGKKDELVDRLLGENVIKPSSSSKAVLVKYKGTSNVRGFTKQDFERKGITDQGDVEFNHDNRWVTEVSPEAAGLLVGMGEFEKVTEEDVEQAPQEHVQRVPEMGEVLPGEKTERTKAPLATQDEGDSHKES